MFHPRLDRALQYFTDQGFYCEEGNCLRAEHKHVSGPRHQRADEFMRFLLDPSIAAVFPPWGGELAMEVLPLLDFESLRRQNRIPWVVGYSDISTLLFAMTLLTGHVTAHSMNLMDFGARILTPQHEQLIQILRSQGGMLMQTASLSWQMNSGDIVQDPGTSWNLTEPTQWKSLDGKAHQFQGRAMGGCLDTISALAGTAFGNLERFAAEAAPEGLVLYFENCDGTPCQVARWLWSMQHCGWFKHANGILLGRSTGSDASSEDRLTYREALASTVGELGIPVIYDVDIGHRPPQLTLLNGAIVQVHFEVGQTPSIRTFLNS
jgi:muramoyltetrapeptide carboxypeptidase